MTAEFKPFRLKGFINAPPSKSMAHRYLIGAALSKEKCVISGVDYSEDILATIDCLKALGAETEIEKDTVTVNPVNFLKTTSSVLNCRESGSTLRFFIPLALCTGNEITLQGSKRLFERPLDIYENLCADNNFRFTKEDTNVTLCGKLKSGEYKIKGNVSSQFITGLIFALLYLGEDSSIQIIPPFESRSYINLTISALKSFGADICFEDELNIRIRKSDLHSFSGCVEGDYSNAAFLEAFSYTGSDIEIGNLKADSLQGDRIYKKYFRRIAEGTPTLDISDCPDLGPVLIALASLKNGAILTGTDRLKAKESDRGLAMHEELSKLGGGLIFGNNTITVPKQNLRRSESPLNSHNDHRIVMALSLILSEYGGKIDGAEAVRKSYPAFFEDIVNLGAKVNIT
ncbi:MAG: 3-phosphoshikimate 1-carboxyvinyltransferase [Ruminococcaceae bacterium]|nr:3-phosphoshikimate 1-carboxyvinyltransferase [Oscillospiraceae bacterium]